MATTRAEALLLAVDRYWTSGNRTLADIPDFEKEILALTNLLFDSHNGAAPKDERWAKIHALEPVQIAQIILRLYTVALIDLCDGEFNTEYGLLGIYMETGPGRGTYQTSEVQIQKIINDISPAITMKGIKETVDKLRIYAKVVCRTTDPNLIPVNNGIFDYEKKTLLDFSPEYVYLCKCPVDYIPQAQNPVIHDPGPNTDWDIESWMASLSDDPEIVNLLWQLVGAVIRPGVRWNKAAWLFSKSGNNGKGTLCELMRTLCGKNNYASISLEDFSKADTFLLEPLIRASAVIVDENNVGAYIDKSKDLKAVITGDIIQINRKFKTPIAYKFNGFMVQCLNDYPKIKDRSDSFARRQLIIPMTKCFTGMENKAIKEDYLHRDEVLQYALCRVLHMDYYSLSEPASCRNLLEDYRESNDILRTFALDVLDRLVWDIVPFDFLYDLYTAWTKRNNPSGSLPSIATFKDDIVTLIQSVDYGWYCNNKMKTVWIPKKDKVTPEPLILEYNLTAWMNKHCKTNDVDKLCIPSDSKRGDVARGIRRKPGWIRQIPVPDEEAEEEIRNA